MMKGILKSICRFLGFVKNNNRNNPGKPGSAQSQAGPGPSTCTAMEPQAQDLRAAVDGTQPHQCLQLQESQMHTFYGMFTLLAVKDPANSLSILFIGFGSRLSVA